MKKTRTKRGPVRRSKKRTRKPSKRVAKKTTKRKPAEKKVVKKPAKKKMVKKKRIKKAKKRVSKPKKPRITMKRIKRKKVARKPKKKIVKKKTVKKTRRPKRKIKKLTPRKKKISRKKLVKRRRKKVKVIKRTYSGGGTLEQLFESPIKTQIMKLFFRNPEANFLLKEAAKIMRNNLTSVRKEMKRLEKIGLLRSRKISSRKQVFAINPNFDFFNELRELILKASPISKEKMLKAIRGLGKVRLVLLSGIFMGSETSRADLLIVGDNINQRKLSTFIKNLEAEAGTDINCVAMTTEEFNYRYDMYDRFVRDLLSDKCEFLINRLGL